jgi:hypothetical protein
MRIPRVSNLFPPFQFVIVALVLGWAGSAIADAHAHGANANAQSQGAASHWQARLEFTKAELFLELNDTDGDLGIHASIDSAEPWTQLEIEGPSSRTVADVRSSGSLRRQGLNQLSFESAEPPFDQLAPADFFRRFPEGRYEIEGVTQRGAEIASTALLSQVLAARPENLSFSGTAAAENCGVTPLPTVTPPVIVRWDPVTKSHPEIGKKGPVEVSQYQLFVEGQAAENPVSLSVDLPPSVTQFTIPEAVTSLGKEFKFEIIVRTSAHNNTAVETCFRLP